MMRKNNQNENEEFRIRFIEVTVKGSSATLQEALRSVADAVGQKPSPPPPRALSQGHQSNGSAPQQVLDFEEGQVVEDTESSSESSKSRSSIKRSYPVPKFLDDLDLRSGEPSLEEFCKQKAPSDTTKKYLVCAVWLKRYRQIDSVTADHIYTCYRTMRWGIHKDVGKPLRNAKSNDYFKKGPTTGSYTITHIGENAVDKLGGNEN